MNLLERLKAHGVTTSVANVKKGSIEDRIIKIKADKISSSKIPYDVRFLIKKDKRGFELSKNFFDSIPSLVEPKVGFNEMYIDDEVYMYLCEDGVKNDLDLIPKYLDGKKGGKKGLYFKAMSLEFCLLKAGLILEDNLKEEDHTLYFNLATTEVANLYKVVPATIDVNVTDVVDMNDNYETVSEEVLQELEEVEVVSHEESAFEFGV